MKERIKHFLLFIVLLVIDQASKYWVRTDLAQREPIVLIRDVLSLQFLKNTGAVWGLMSDKTTFLSIFTLIVLIFIIYFYLKIPSGKKYNVLKVIVVFITAGAIGNLIDRIFLGYVTDFIYFELINFPLFNFADSCLTVSSILLFLLAIFYYKDEDFAFLDRVFRPKKANADKKLSDASEEHTNADHNAPEDKKDTESDDLGVTDEADESDLADKADE